MAMRTPAIRRAADPWAGVITRAVELGIAAEVHAERLLTSTDKARRPDQRPGRVPDGLGHYETFYAHVLAAVTPTTSPTVVAERVVRSASVFLVTTGWYPPHHRDRGGIHLPPPHDPGEHPFRDRRAAQRQRDAATARVLRPRLEWFTAFATRAAVEEGGHRSRPGTAGSSARSSVRGPHRRPPRGSPTRRHLPKVHEGSSGMNSTASGTGQTVAQFLIERIVSGSILPACSLGDLADLATCTIQTLGLQSPIVITSDGVLISGRRRLEVMRQLGHSTVPVWIASEVSGQAADADGDPGRQPSAQALHHHGEGSPVRGV